MPFDETTARREAAPAQASNETAAQREAAPGRVKLPSAEARQAPGREQALALDDARATVLRIDPSIPDPERAESASPERRAAADVEAPAHPVDEQVAPDAERDASAPAAAEESSLERRPDVPPPVERRGAAILDLDGWWEITHEVDPDHGDSPKPVGYRVRLERDGDRVTGRGFKWRKGERPLPPRQRTPVSLSGTVAGSAIEIVLVEHSSRRPSTGRIQWMRAQDGESLNGRFVTSNGTGGTSVAVKAAPPVEKAEPTRSSRQRRRANR